MVRPRLLFKLILRKFRLIPSFCKICGRTNHDFIVEDKLWKVIENDIKYGNVLCYDCFCELISKKGYLGVYRLEEID